MSLPVKLQQLKGNITDDSKYLIDFHLKIMEYYGWIPTEEFMKIPIPMINNMLERIRKAEEETPKTKNMPKIPRRRR